MDKTEKYNIASMDIHGHGCDVTELKHVLPPEEFAIETASLFGLLSDSTRLRILYLYTTVKSVLEISQKRLR